MNGFKDIQSFWQCALMSSTKSPFQIKTNRQNVHQTEVPVSVESGRTGVRRWAEASAGTSKLFCDSSTALDYFYWLTDFLSGGNGCPGGGVETHDG